jgi:glycosyltransferase involved in cell wall biosynthesis
MPIEADQYPSGAPVLGSAPLREALRGRAGADPAVTAIRDRGVLTTNRVVLDVWAHVDPRFGGVGPAASALACAVERCSGMHTHQIAICDDTDRKLADGIDSNVRRIEHSGVRGLADIRLSKILKPLVAASDICHIHGLWVAHSLAIRRLAVQMGKPLVSSVHGMLERWEMENKRAKKAIYSWLFERPSLSRSSCLRALSFREVGDYKRFGVRSPIALIPNGINALDRVPTSDFLAEFPELRGKKIVLFLGRIHHKKGVLNLVQAWKAVLQRHEDAHLVIAGPDYVGTEARVKQLVGDLKLTNAVSVMGVISGRKKLAALSTAMYFCLPSYSEGLSVAILEALSLGLPAIITPECNIPSVASSGAGVSTLNDPAELADTIISCLGATSREWCDMSRAAQRLARSEFDWDTTGQAMHSVYEWLLGGDRPACVIG